MSINVNVSGNPISIRRGKMVTADPDYAKKEFQKRRKIRLEQVRQQSKDIAESVRNKVRGEKSKKLSDLEKRSERELKKWQNRKLLQLQQQYQECLKDIGLGHAEAVGEEESDYVFESRKGFNEEIARERGERAAEKLQQEKQNMCGSKIANLQKRRHNEIVEKTRAKMVADLDKNKNKRSKEKKKRKVSTDINISSRLSSSSDSETEVNLLNLSSSSSEESDNSTPRRDEESRIKSRTRLSDESTRFIKHSSKENRPSESIIVYNDKLVEPEYISSKIEQARNHRPSEQSDTVILPEKNHSRDLDEVGNKVNYLIDTRISDRIKNRCIFRDTCSAAICDIANEAPSRAIIHSDHTILPKQIRSSTSIAQQQNGQLVSRTSLRNLQEDIPNKPPITLRTKSETTNRLKPSVTSSVSNLNKVQYYDHSNRFTKEYTVDSPNVHKIPDDSVEVLVSNGSEAEFVEHMYKRDREAQARGQKALEKEKVHRDYKEIMKELPKLQKQERIASIPIKKSTFHMSEGRLKMEERKRQNNMENAYERLFPNSRMVTLPPKNATKGSSTTFQPIRVLDSQPTLNVGSWEFDIKSQPEPDLAPKHVESNLINDVKEKSIGHMEAPNEEALERKQNLNEMLGSLKYHRDKLASELSSLPASSKLRNLFGELQTIDELIGEGNSANERSSVGSKLKRTRSRRIQKERRKAKDSSSSLSPSYRIQKERDGSREKERKISKYHTRCASGSSTSPSPPSKIINIAKGKTKRNESPPARLVLQNISTQTTPVVTKKSVETKVTDVKQKPSPSLSAGKLLKVTEVSEKKSKVPCECHLQKTKEQSDLCEIVIKFTDDGKSQISVSPTRLQNKQIIVKPGTQNKKPSVVVEQAKPPPSTKPTVTEKPTPTDHIKVKQIQTQPAEKQNTRTKKQSTSWREYFSQNSTSSTSYMSPPNFASTHIQPQPSDNKPNDQRREGAKLREKTSEPLRNILKNKPQQSNIDNNTLPFIQSASESRNILCYIKQLLTMSRGSVDELTVSSVSEISTPSSSITNVQSNVPLQHLESFMQRFNVDLSEIERFLNYSAEGSNIHYNTTESLPLSSNDSQISIINSADKSKDVRDATLDDYSTENYPGVLEVYNKLAENCTKKIENLASMIEKVRLEKISMLQSSSGSEKENSTKYFNLPAEVKKDKESSSNSSLEQAELERQLLEVDFSYAERLKKMTPAEIRANITLSSTDSNDLQDISDSELLTRFRNLLEGHRKNDNQSKATENIDKTPKTAVDNMPFVPLIMDIPRLPKFEAHQAVAKADDRPKPPPSKGLFAVKRFNNNINIIPHELSTIAESESLQSMRAQKSKTPEKPARLTKNVDLNQDLAPVIMLQQPKIPQQTSGSKQSSADSNFCSSSTDSLPDILTELMRNARAKIAKNVDKSSETSPSKSRSKETKNIESDSSVSELENMEAMLKSLGMGWAVATLRKTQEALALTSSSSSVDISLKQRAHKDSSCSTIEVSLREILGRQFLTKLSPGKSEDSHGSSRFLKELQEGSLTEKTNRRTSTPVQSSKTTDKSKNDSQPPVTITGESELSSVRANSDSVPFYTLNESSIRSRNNSKSD